jgi:hypothetical protein
MIYLKNVWLTDFDAVPIILLIGTLFLLSYLWLAKRLKLISDEDWGSFTSWIGLSFLRS